MVKGYLAGCGLHRYVSASFPFKLINKSCKREIYETKRMSYTATFNFKVAEFAEKSENRIAERKIFCISEKLV